VDTKVRGVQGRQAPAGDVRRFYDANTWQFLLFGSGRAIHRELYPPGITERAAALAHAHALIGVELDLAGAVDGGRVLDLGCGVGAGARYLATVSGVSVHGVTISPRQVALARRFTAGRREFAGRVTFAQADFCDLPTELTGFDLGYSIEAFVHAPSAQRYFAAAAGALRPAGRLVVIDDFLTAAGASAADRPPVSTARDGWHLQSLPTVGAATALAADSGLRLVADRDLSAYQRLGRPRDRVIRRAQPVLRAAAPYNRWCQMLVGGDALQAGHQQGLLGYHELVFARS